MRSQISLFGAKSASMSLIALSLASLSSASPAAQTEGVSSVRRSINFGPHLEGVQYSLVKPSTSLIEFNQVAQVYPQSANCLPNPQSCLGRSIAIDFIASLHPYIEFELVDSYLSTSSQLYHSYFLRKEHGLVVANGNLNINVDTLTGKIVSYGDKTYAAPSPVTAPVWTHSESNQVVLGTDDAPQDIEQFSSPPLIAATPHSRARDPRHGLLAFLAIQAPSLDLINYLATTDRDSLVNSMKIHGMDSSYKIIGAPTAVGEHVPATLVYILDDAHSLKLAWKFVLRTDDNEYEAYVQADAAVDGEEEIYMAVDWVRDYRPTGGEVGFTELASNGGFATTRQSFQATEVSSATPLPTTPIPSGKPSYKVFPWGINAPDEGNRKILKGTAVELDSEASPYGWHTVPSSVTGGKDVFYSDTRGNNVLAQENWSGGNTYLNGLRPSGVGQDGGKSGLSFDFPIHLPAAGVPLDPKSYINASVTELFYTNNEIHDLFYRYGFDEVAGNFQEANFERGGRGGDAVQANAQDGSGVNNANFATPPDGSRPRMRMFYWNQQQPYRDGAFEAGIVIHEYSHGISTRLVGGPANSGCLPFAESGGMGEGWGDFFATMIRQHSANETDFAMGAWASGRAAGIRNFRYSQNMTINTDTYKTLDKPGYWGVHAIGEVWAEMLFEMAENLIIKHGFESTLFHPAANTTSTFYNDKYERKVPKSGNTLAIQLVIDGLKISPCRPSFSDARDAIITADAVLTGGDNACLLWKAFAKRGLGPGASVIGSTPWGGGKHFEDYTVPAKCISSK